MSNIHISQVRVANPTELTPVRGYVNKPATNTIGDFAQRQGLVFENGRLTSPAQEAKELAKLNKELDARDAAAAAKKQKEVQQAWQQFDGQRAGQRALNNVKEQLDATSTRVDARYIDNMLGIDREAKSAEASAGAFIKHDVAQKLGQPTNITSEGIDQMLGIGREAKSAEASAGAFIKQDVAQRLSQPTNITSEGIDQMLGIGREAKSAEASAGAFIKQDVAQRLSQPTNITSEGIDQMLGIGRKAKSAEASAGVYIKQGIEDATKDAGKISATSVENMLGLHNIPKSANESFEVFNQAGMVPKKTGFLTKVGNFFKKHGKKLAIAAGIIAGLALLYKACTGSKKSDKPEDTTPVPVVPPTKPGETDSTTTPVVPVTTEEPEEPTTPVAPEGPEDKIHNDGTPEPNYTLNAKYCGMSQYVAAAYGVNEGSEQHAKILEKVWDVNPGLRNTTLSIGDQVYLPKVELEEETFEPDLEKQPNNAKKPKKSEKLDNYNGYEGKDVYGTGKAHDDNANQYHDTDKEKVEKKAEELDS